MTKQVRRCMVCYITAFVSSALVLRVRAHVQAQMFEEKCKELRDELKEAREEMDRLNALLADMVPRAELSAARKVRVSSSL